MSPERIGDAQADAVLLALIRFLTDRAGSYGLGGQVAWSTDVGVLTEEGIELIADRMLASDQLRQNIRRAKDVEAQMASLGAYHRHREPLDRLWEIVEIYGLPTLLREAQLRTRDVPNGDRPVQE